MSHISKYHDVALHGGAVSPVCLGLRLWYRRGHRHDLFITRGRAKVPVLWPVLLAVPKLQFVVVEVVALTITTGFGGLPSFYYNTEPENSIGIHIVKP